MGQTRFGSRSAPIRTHRPTAKPTLTFLEDRSVPATLTDGGTSTLTIDLDGTNEQLSVSTDGTNYSFAVNGANTFTDGGVASPRHGFRCVRRRNADIASDRCRPLHLGVDYRQHGGGFRCVP